MRPFRIPKNMNDMSQIKIFPNDRASWMSWSQEIEKFLQPYTKTSNFTLDKLGPCGISPYGYNESMICIYLKLNKIYGVENSPCNLTELDSKSHKSERMENPCSEMPLGLQEVIKNTNDPNQVWIECHGKTEKIGQNPVFRAISSPKSPKLSILEHFQILKNFVVFYVKLHEKVRFDPHS